MSLSRCFSTLLLVTLISACGGGNSPQTDVTVPATPAPAPIDNVLINSVTANTAQVSFTTALETEPTVMLVPKNASGTMGEIVYSLRSNTTHQVTIENLWSDTDYRLKISTANADYEQTFLTQHPIWADSCRQGDFLIPVTADSGWNRYTDSNGTVEIREIDGCNGTNATEFSFDLGSGEWVVAAQQTPFNTPIDLANYSHLWIPIKGEINTPVAFEIKAKDSQNRIGTIRLDGGTGVPVWRNFTVDLRQFRKNAPALDLSSLVSLEFGFSWPKRLGGKRHGIVRVGQISAWNLDEKVNVPEALEPVIPNIDAMTSIANDLLDRQQSHGFIPAWFELTPNWHLYANAMALIVFSLEYERLSALNDPQAIKFADAAQKMADELVRLQQLSNRNGAWDDSFAVANNILTRLPEHQRVMWVGSTAWAGIALVVARKILPNGARYEQAIDYAASYYHSQQQCRIDAGLPLGSITEGTEGNISSHLFLLAAQSLNIGDTSISESLKGFIQQELFDPLQRRFFCGVSVDIGAFDEQSCTISGSGQIIYPDAQACLDVIGNWGAQWLLIHGQTNNARRALGISHFLFQTTDFYDENIKGLGDIAGPWTPTVEHGAGQYALQSGKDSNFIMNQAYQHLCQNGTCQGASNNITAGIGWNTTAHGIAPAAWMYLAWHGQFWSYLQD